MANGNEDKNSIDPTKLPWYRQIFSDSKGMLSSGRIMQMIGLLAVCSFLIVQAFNPSCSGAYDLTLGVIGGGALGSKAWQKHAEK